jgi:hypothetical protein
MKSVSAQRLIYMTQSRGHAINQGAFSLVAFALGFGSQLLFPFLGYVFWTIAAYFLFNSAMNFLAYRRHSKAAQDSEFILPKMETDQLDIGEVAEKIDLGAQEGVIRFIYSEGLLSTHKQSLDKIFEFITKNKDEFIRQFVVFRAENAKNYPKYASFISGLKIHSIMIFPSKKKGQCIASICFAGDVGEVWSARYVDGSFSELIWN